MDDKTARHHPQQTLHAGMLGTGDIIFMVLACAAPMGVLAGPLTFAFALGNGVGTPGALLGVYVMIMLFAVGYVRMIPYVRNAGAFYAYIATSINKEAGIAAAYVAVIAYIAATISVIGAMSFFAAEFVRLFFGFASRWELWAAIGIVITAYLGYKKITMAAKVLTVALVLEIVIILIIDILILHERGLPNLDFSSFALNNILAPGLGITVAFGVNGVVGFEATAIYQEEARNRKVTIPRATYGVVMILAAFYLFSSWSLVQSVLPENVKTVAAADPGRFVAGIAEHHLGDFGRDALNLLTVTSLFAAGLALFNNATRYMFALSRDGLISASLGRVHPRNGSPYIAGFVLTAILVIVIGLFALAGLDPLLSLATSLSSMGAIGLLFMLTATSLSVPVFFAKRREYSIGKTLAPLTGGLMLLAATYLSLANYPALTGTDSPIINGLPFLFLPLAAFGFFHGRYLRNNRPDIYARVGSTRVEDDNKAPVVETGDYATANAVRESK